MPKDHRSVLAFNDGCDARIAGKPRADNPWGQSGGVAVWTAWDQGWRHCDKHWGEDAAWPVLDLPDADPALLPVRLLG